MSILTRTGVVFRPNVVTVRFGSTLKVLLIENVINRGQKGEIVKVKRGYFRNMLFPRKMAVYATDVNLERYKYLIKPAGSSPA